MRGMAMPHPILVTAWPRVPGSIIYNPMPGLRPHLSSVLREWAYASVSLP